MYIRIVFDRLKYDEWAYLLGSPNGTVLCSANALRVLPEIIPSSCVYFWYLDINIINKFWGGVIKALSELNIVPGVISIDILPINYEAPSSLANTQLQNLQSELNKFINISYCTN